MLSTRCRSAVTAWKPWPWLPATSCQVRVSPLWVMALLPIHHPAGEGQPHVHHGSESAVMVRGAGGLLIVRRLVVGGAVEAAFTERHPVRVRVGVSPSTMLTLRVPVVSSLLPRSLVAVDDIDLERQFGGVAAALVYP